MQTRVLFNVKKYNCINTATNFDKITQLILNRLYKRTKYVAKNKAQEEKEIFYESQYFDDQIVKPKRFHLFKPKNKEIFSQEHTGIYKKIRVKDLGEYENTDESIHKNLQSLSSKIINEDDSKKIAQLIIDEQDGSNSKIFCCCLEEDDGVYEDTYEEIDWNEINMPFLVIFECILCVLIILVLYFIYDVASK